MKDIHFAAAVYRRQYFHRRRLRLGQAQCETGLAARAGKNIAAFGASRRQCWRDGGDDIFSAQDAAFEIHLRRPADFCIANCGACLSAYVNV